LTAVVGSEGTIIDQLKHHPDAPQVTPLDQDYGSGTTDPGDGVGESSRRRSADPRSAPLNQILFGPPGTGKTYRTTDLALEICGVAAGDGEARRDEFRRLVEEQRIFFVTFHQSFSYEDFVEGIRAETDDETGQVRYATRDGVFKTACSRAIVLGGEGDSSSPEGAIDVDLDQVAFWKVSLGSTLEYTGDQLFEECLEKGRIAIGYGHDIDFGGCSTRESILKRFGSSPDARTPNYYDVTAIQYFYNDMGVGDLVIVPDGNLKFRAVARITGDASVDIDTGLQTRSVDWLRVYSDTSQPVELLLRKNFSQQTVYSLRESVLKKETLTRILGVGSADGIEGEETPNCVLIIDEINRANVAKVLGELITLLEPDKRLGARNEQRVTLPYSRESFGVPSNLFVVGTMNTSDRSIASLDVALRRRFAFRELMPDYKLVEQRASGFGISIGELLRHMNERIEVLVDRDHVLGHAYFLEVATLDDLKEVFLERVIPLLQEYFFLDWRKICLVLGCGVDDSGRTKNGAPLVSAELRRVAELFDRDFDEFEDSPVFEVNPEFVDAHGEALRPFLSGILGDG